MSKSVKSLISTVQKQIATEKAFTRKTNKKLEKTAYALAVKMWTHANFEKRTIEQTRATRNKKIAEKKRIRAANEKSRQHAYGLVVRMWVQVDKEYNGTEKVRIAHIRALNQKSKEIHRMERTILPSIKLLYKNPRKSKKISESVVESVVECVVESVVERV